MKLFQVLAAFLFCFILLSSTAAQDYEQMMDESQKAWMEYMTPGWAHEQLAKSTGQWKTVSKFWMMPGSEPTISEGTAVFEMIMGGRYQVSSHSGMVWGMQMEGMNIVGYDNAKQEFISVWIDNMGTGIMTASGQFDQNTNTVHLKGSMVDPLTKQEMQIRMTVKFESDDKHVFEMLTDYEGQEFKMMETVYTR